MKERPILFSAPMVRAILEGRKTQTRRVIKPRKSAEGLLCDPIATQSFASEHLESLEIQGFDCEHVGEGQFRVFPPCPYGEVGTRLWVRETWAKNTGIAGGFLYRADHGGCASYASHNLASGMTTHSMDKWKPSIHMPRWASRITLEITGVRVERLNDISEQDAMEEGIQCTKGILTGNKKYWVPDEGYECFSTASSAFRELWESINGAGSWQQNPWVWVVEFRRVE